ncbi:hypothetical protein LCGC14_2887460, partial [marine sediment metagenome]
MSKEPHELFKFMKAMSVDMAMEYDRIRQRAAEDPGTAGDEGEESWAELLRNWLPSTYHVVTKGRILFEDNTASPQVDILVLTPNYPLHLQNKKMYFAGGVVAAFECKLTLKKKHFTELFETSQSIKSKFESEGGNPYEDFNAPIIYGLLAQSHSWSKKKPVADQVFSIFEKFHDPKKGLKINDARYYPDIICVSDTVTYCFTKRFTIREDLDEGDEELLDDVGSDHVLSLSYDAFWSDSEDSWLDGTVHGTLLSFLLKKIAYHDESVRNIS